MGKIYVIFNPVDRFCLNLERRAFVLGVGIFFGETLAALLTGVSMWSVLALSLALVIYGVWRPTFNKLGLPYNAQWTKPHGNE